MACGAAGCPTIRARRSHADLRRPCAGRTAAGLASQAAAASRRAAPRRRPTTARWSTRRRWSGRWTSAGTPSSPPGISATSASASPEEPRARRDGPRRRPGTERSIATGRKGRGVRAAPETPRAGTEGGTGRVSADAGQRACRYVLKGSGLRPTCRQGDTNAARLASTLRSVLPNGPRPQMGWNERWAVQAWRAVNCLAVARRRRPGRARSSAAVSGTSVRPGNGETDRSGRGAGWSPGRSWKAVAYRAAPLRAGPTAAGLRVLATINPGPGRFVPGSLVRTES